MVERLVLVYCIAILFICPASAAEDKNPSPLNSDQTQHKPTISIIIDDLGEQLIQGLRAVKLPGQVTYAILPHTPYSYRLAVLAHDLNKEIMLHMPMESIHHHNLGRGGLTHDMAHQEFVDTIHDALVSVPHISGINNHMGSLLTQQHNHMLWLMQEINQYGNLFFVDSRTITNSVAHKVATEKNIPNLRRDIFLDNDRDLPSIRQQFRNLIAIARKKGTALAIGHPYPQTLAFLEKELPTLKTLGIELVSVSKLIQRKRSLDIIRMARRAPSTSLASKTTRADNSQHQILVFAAPQ